MEPSKAQTLILFSVKPGSAIPYTEHRLEDQCVELGLVRKTNQVPAWCLTNEGAALWESMLH